MLVFVSSALAPVFTAVMLPHQVKCSSIYCAHRGDKVFMLKNFREDMIANKNRYTHFTVVVNVFMMYAISFIDK